MPVKAHLWFQKNQRLIAQAGQVGFAGDCTACCNCTLKNSTPQNDKAVERVETNKSTCTIHYSGTRCLRFIPGIQSKQSGWAETGRRTPLEMLRTANEHRQRTNQKSSTTAQSIFSMHLKSQRSTRINRPHAWPIVRERYFTRLHLTIHGIFGHLSTWDKLQSSAYLRAGGKLYT